MKKQAIAIDLDGTLIMGNTFHDYLSFCGKKALACCRFDLCLVILWMVLLRKLRLVSHARMKRVLLSETSVFFSQKGRLEIFVEEELQQLNPKVMAQIEAFRKQGFALALVTAAPVSYAQEMADRLCFDACLATPLPSSLQQEMWQENKAEKKVEALQQWLVSEDLQLSAVITDHTDDLPLAQAASESVFLYSSNKKISAAFSQQISCNLVIIS